MGKSVTLLEPIHTSDFLKYDLLGYGEKFLEIEVLKEKGICSLTLMSVVAERRVKGEYPL